MPQPPFFALCAAEPSGDLLAAHLLAALRAGWPGLRAAGIGEPRMRYQKGNLSLKDSSLTHEL